MSEAKFTPGPWSIERYGDGSSLVIHSDAENRVCFMATASSDRPSSHPSIRANARLIAAAPDLYEALHEAERLYSARGLLANDPAAGAWINSARDALARAGLVSAQARDGQD